MEKEAKSIGKKTGAATSAALGLAIGGPLVGAASFGLWYAGQAVADHVVESGKNVFQAAVS